MALSSDSGPTRPDCAGAPVLRELGWSLFFENQLRTANDARHLIAPARVIEERRGAFVVSDGTLTHEAQVSGKMRFDAVEREDLPAVGDWVLFTPGANDARVIIHTLLRRRSKLSRKEPGFRTREQVLAANVDTVFLVQALGRDFNLRRLERVIALARQGGSEPVVVLTKSDLCTAPHARVAEVESRVPGVAVHAISALSGEGLETIERHLVRGRTVALLGSSGVGKSTLINRLFDDAACPVGDVRAADGRGRHTTTSRQLFVRPAGGILVDTPGLREIQLWGDGEGAQGAFDEIADLASDCRFRDCRHRDEPGCAVRAALDDGALDDGRYASFQKLDRELERITRRQRHSARRRERRAEKRVRPARRVDARELAEWG